MSNRLDPLIQEKLRAFARRRRRLIVSRGVFAALAMLLLTMLVIAAIDRFIVLPDWVRWALTGTAYTTVLIIAWRQCLTWLLHAPDERQLARLVEHAEPHLREDLLSAVELGRNSGDVFDSEQFRELVQQDVSHRMESVEVKSLLPVALIRRYIGYAFCILALVIAMGVATGWQFRTLMLRALWPGANLDRISRTKVIIKTPVNGNDVVAHGDTVRVEIELNGERANKADIEIFAEKEGWRSMEMQPIGKDQFAATINVGRESLRYRIKAGDALTRKYLLDAKERPFVTQFEKTYHYPDYTKLPVKTEMTPDGSIIALDGTKVDLKLATNQGIRSGELALEQGRNSKVIPLTVGTDGFLRAQVEINASGTYRVKLTSKETGFQNIFSPENELRAVLDLPPAVELESPKTDLILSNNELVDLIGRAEDDLGVAKITQAVKINDGGWKHTVVDESGTQKVRLNHRWDLYDLRLKAGDLVTTKFIATDTKGAKGESRPLLITITAAGFELRRLQALEAIRALNSSVFALSETAKALSETSKKSREGFDATENADTRRQTVVALTGAIAEVELKHVEAWTALATALREAGAGHSSAELVALGKVLGRLSAVDLRIAKANADLLSTNPSLAGAKDIMLEADRISQQFYYRSLLAAGSMEQFTTAAETAVIAENAQVVYREQQRLKDLADRSGSDRAKWEPLLSRLRISLTQVKALEDLLAPIGDRKKSPKTYDAQRVMKTLAKSRGKLEQALAMAEPSAKLLLGPTNELNDALRDHSKQFYDWQREASGKPAEKMQEIAKDLAPTYTNIARLTQDFSTIRSNKQFTPETQVAMLDTRWLGRADVLRKHGDVEEIRPTADNLFVSDLRTATAALEAIHAVEPGTERAKIDAKLVEMDAALQLLESGHNLQEMFDGLNFLATNERWDLRNLSARTQSPMDWKWLHSRLENTPEEFNKVREGLKRLASLPPAVPQTEGTPWNLDDASKAVEQARELMVKAWESPERNGLTNEMNQRANLDRLPASSKADAERLAGRVKFALDSLRKQMQTARERLAKLSPKISEIAAALAKEQAELKKETTEQAEKTEQQKPEEAKSENQQKLAEQQKLNQKVETLKDLLRAEANKQNILNPEQREAMRDADDSLAMLKEPPPKAEQALQDATNDAQTQQKADLERATEQQQKLTDALNKIAEHFEAVEEGKDLAETRADLREAEKALGVKEELDEQYAHAQMLAELAQKNAAELLKELEAKLPDNPLMQKELSNITKDALANAEQKLQQASKQENTVAQQVAEQAKMTEQQLQQQAQKQVQEQVAKTAAEAAKQAMEAATAAAKLAEAAEKQGERSGNAPLDQQGDTAQDKAVEAAQAAKQAMEAAEKLAKANTPQQANEQAAAVAQKAGEAAKAARESMAAAKEAQATASKAAETSQNQNKAADQQAAQQAGEAAKQAEKSAQAAEQAQALAQQAAQAMSATAQNAQPQTNPAKQAANMAAEAAQKAAQAAQAAQKAAESAETQANNAENPAAAQKADTAGQQAAKAAQSAQQAAASAKAMAESGTAKQMAEAAQAAAQQAGEAAQAAEQAASAAEQAQASAQQAAQAGGENQGENQQAAQQSGEAAQQAKTAAQAAKQAQAMAQAAANAAKAMAQQNQQLAAAAQQQPAIAQNANEAGTDVERAGRHEMRLGNQEAGQQLQALGNEVQETAQAEVPAAAKALNAAQMAAQAQGAVNQANAELAQELNALQQAQQGTPPAGQPPAAGAPPAPAGQTPPAAGAQAQAQPAGAAPAAAPAAAAAAAAAPAGAPAGATPPPPSGESAAPAAPASPAEQLAMARALDALDQQLNAPAGSEAAAAAAGEPAAAGQPAGAEGQPAQAGEPSGQGAPAPGSPQAGAAQAAMAQAAQAAQAAMRQGRAQMGTAQMPGSMVSQSQSEKSEGGATAQGSAMEYTLSAQAQAAKRGEWGKLPKKLAEQLTKGQQETVAGDYRQAVETYYKVIAEKAKQQK
jgi:hypothetical protein